MFNKDISFDVTSNGELAIIEKANWIIKSVVVLSVEDTNRLIDFARDKYNFKTCKFEFEYEE